MKNINFSIAFVDVPTRMTSVRSFYFIMRAVKHTNGERVRERETDQCVHFQGADFFVNRKLNVKTTIAL